MTKEKVIPQIRFSGFTDTWERREFSELTEIRSASRVHKEEWQSSGVPFYRSSDVMAALNGTENEKAFISEELYEKLSAVSGKLEKGDVLVTGGGSVGKPYIVPNNEPLYTKDADLLWIKNNENLDPYFVYTFFFSPTFTDYLNSVSHVGTIAHYTITQLGETPITLPCVSEQQKIGDYFRNLDSIITLHQRKYDKLTKVKKAMLEKMFPENGSPYPEIRFKGFTDAWEQRKLSAIADKVTEKNVGLQYIETFTNSAEFGIISQRDFFDHDIAKMSSLGGYYIVRSEDFVYNPRISTSAPVGPINRNKLGRIGVMSPLYTVFRPHDIDTTYLEYFFKSKYWHSFMNFNGDSGARSDRFSIKDSVFFEMPIPIPHIDEQKKIGAFLDKLDSLITLHQRKLEKLKNIKKACLEKMFV